MSDVFKKQYEEAVKDKPKGWVPHVNGTIGDRDAEISCAHTDYPHGFISWGWGGTHKLIFEDATAAWSEDSKKKRKGFHQALLKCAADMCEVLNKHFPNGMDEYEEKKK